MKTRDELLNQVKTNLQNRYYLDQEQQELINDCVDELLKAINYIPCCTQLKVKKTPSFEDWLITMQIQKTGRTYFAKDGTEQDFNALHRRYVQTLQEQYF